MLQRDQELKMLKMIMLLFRYADVMLMRAEAIMRQTAPDKTGALATGELNQN